MTTNELLSKKLDLIIDMMLTSIGRNLDVSFKEIQEFQNKAKELGIDV